MLLKIRIAVSLIFLIVAGNVFSQTQPVRGVVLLVKEDGTKVPVENALVEPYRMDTSSGRAPSAKTNKRGEFNFAGFQLGARYALAISGPGIAPNVFPNVSGGAPPLELLVQSGDGRQLTEKEVRDALVNAGPARELTEEEKKQQAEFEAKYKEIEEKNARVKATTELIDKALKEGNAAFNAGDMDLAIAKYEEGIKADPDFVGSAPVLLNNKGAALTRRAVSAFNANAKSTDPAARQEALVKVRNDFSEAAESYNRSWAILNNAPAAAIQDQTLHEANKTTALRGARETFRLAVRTEQIDPEKTALAKTLLTAAIAAENDKAKKAETMLILADVYRVSQDSENAIAVYKEVLASSPENIDALAGAGLSLVNLGYLNSDEATLQEGANYLQKFAELAPADHKYKNDAVGLIEVLKNEKNIMPQKTSAPRRRKN